MAFMVPAGIRLDMADGSLCLPDEERFQLSGRRQLFKGSSRLITFDQHYTIPVAGSVEIALRRPTPDKQKLWVTRGEQWVPTAIKGLGRTQYLCVRTIGDVTTRYSSRYLTGKETRTANAKFCLDRRYAEWQKLALQTTIEQQAADEVVETATEPTVDRPQYKQPTKILSGRQEHRKTMIVLSTPAKESNKGPRAKNRQGFSRRKRAIPI
ncbi:LOW QUALITY PROTEIN: hypothetical protein PHMEG_0006241 [Phytophthora megakarya]|uniref:Eukaryotic/viral aspartic protease n=1 Tax=Phytophthora megakarya TaxID=4795 RepID=A0A225WPE7_9STRA|nr:LOW QUALITY PROTEIN: hypothetical protein PHMEG_0006241 [Phytophthora megakarya]